MSVRKPAEGRSGKGGSEPLAGWTCLRRSVAGPGHRKEASGEHGDLGRAVGWVSSESQAGKWTRIFG